MEKWQKRLKHHRDICDAQAESTDQPKLTHPENGVHQPHWRQISGKKFFEIVSQKGHDFAEYERCKCSRT